MYLPDVDDPQLHHLADQMRALTDDILKDLPPDGETIRLDRTSDLLASQPPARLFRITSGQLSMLHDGKTIAVVEAGDLVGLARCFQIPDGVLQSEDPVEAIPYQREALLRHVASSTALQRNWTCYLLSASAFYRSCLARLVPTQAKPAMGFLDFEAGEIIIREDEDADCVYTLLEGSADAIRRGVKVGEIRAQEIFGAMAVFTGQKRSATVKATSDCSVLAVRKEDFLDLVVHQPQVCVNLIEEMADKIKDLNTQLLELQT
ncbi:cyclic nucleotide-binding domain-containing protein [Proteobacteria bacterium 005FR1]|nr:cyclic nucleotide-binding domain-containing protein [Proteobacteria bacterium 005FR1]